MNMEEVQQKGCCEFGYENIYNALKILSSAGIWYRLIYL